ncbi:MAG: hypothetical protein KC441_14725 [Anaerolineales bacterium]|nr:hypothetical protein [Anaerolineales bacterium]
MVGRRTHSFSQLGQAPPDHFAAGFRQRIRPFCLYLPLALFFLTFILGCSLLNRNTPTPVPEGQNVQVTLVCSPECASRGQCGQTTDGRSVIFGNSDRPSVSDPQMLFNADEAFPLVAANDQRVQVVTTGEQFDTTFYLITRPQDGRSGWVPGWCVQR